MLLHSIIFIGLDMKSSSSRISPVGRAEFPLSEFKDLDNSEVLLDFGRS